MIKDDLNNIDKDKRIEILSLLVKKRFLILIFSVVAGFFSILFSLSLPNTYKASATLISVSHQEPSLGGSLGSLSAAASLAGVNIGGGDVSKTAEALKFLTSYKFFNEVLEGEIHTQNLFAATAWDPKTNLIIYDNDLFDISTQKWTRKSLLGSYLGPPSIQTIHKNFLDMLTIYEDSKTGFIEISFEHVSPFFAKEMVQEIIDKLNHHFRTTEKVVAQKSLEYLNDQIYQTTLGEMRLVLAGLIKNEIQTIALTESTKDYVFKVLDPPIVPEKKSGPPRAIFCILITFAGFIFSLITIVGHNYYQRIIKLVNSVN